MIAKQDEFKDMGFNPVKEEKTSERIVRQIIALISKGTLEPGDKLPPEKILGAQFQASRPSVREAIHTLNVLGLISVKQGAGAYIDKVNHGVLSNYFLILSRIGQFTLSEVSEARLFLEPVIGELAAERAEKEDLIELEKILKSTRAIIETKGNPTPKNIAFHKQLGNTCKNSLLSLILNSILELLVKEIFKFPYDMKTNKDAYAIHEKIFEAIRNRDSVEVSRHIRADIEVSHCNLQRVLTDQNENTVKTKGGNNVL